MDHTLYHLALWQGTTIAITLPQTLGEHLAGIVKVVPIDVDPQHVVQLIQDANTGLSAEKKIAELRAAMQEFVDKVDAGTAKSVKTYARFKELLDAS